MTRVLHIIDQLDPPAGLGSTLALIADTQAKEPGDHRTLLLGGQTIRDTAERVGLRVDKLLPSPTGLARPALAFRKTLRDMLGHADRVDCWSVRAATFAAGVGCSTFNPRFGQVGDTPFAEQTLDPERLQTSADHRTACRKRWGINDNALVIALLTDHPEKHSAIDPALTAALAQETVKTNPHADTEQSEASGTDTPNNALHLLIPPTLKHLPDAERLYNDIGLPHLIIQEPNLDIPWQVLPAVDAALLLQPDLASLSHLWARHAGLPIIQGPDKPKHLAQQLVNAFAPVTS